MIPSIVIMGITLRRLIILSIGTLFLLTLISNISLFYRLNESTSYDDDKDTVSKRDIGYCPLPDQLAVSAMNRMKSDKCKNELRNISCRIEEGTFHEIFPSSSCPLYDDNHSNELIGCFSDSKSNRLLNGHSYTWKEDNSKEKCGLFCSRAGYVYYGLEYGIECFCGDSIDKGNRLEDSRCETHGCSNGNGKCGGYQSIKVYKTGLTKSLSWVRPKYVEVEDGKEYNISILFILQLNGRNVRQVRQMIKSIYSPKHHYYIHVDSRQKYILKEAKRLSSILPNVYLARTLRSTIWGGASLLPMILDGIKDSLHLRWDYMINMSESDELILSMRELEAQLYSRNGSSFLATHGHSTGRFLEKQGFDYVFMECENRMWRIAHRPSFPIGIGLNGGSDWIVIHRNLAEYSIIDESIDELPAKLIRLFSSVILPVESFFHSLAVNSRFCTSVVGGNLRMTNWNRKQGCRCAWLKKVVDWCGCSPLSFTHETTYKFELQKAKERSVYFARKFDSIVSNGAILAAHQQSHRLSSLPWNIDHPRSNSSFVNIYNRDVDTSSPSHSSFLRSIIYPDIGIVNDLFMYKENDDSSIQLVVVYNNEKGEHSERIFDFKFDDYIDEDNSNIGEYFLSSIDIGTDIDHKEEILRGFSKFIPEDGEVTVLLEWLLIGEENSNGTSSPKIKIEWIDRNGRKCATQTVSPYDSTRGRQFAQFDLKLLDDTVAGIWKATVTDENDRVLGSVPFGVFSSNDTISQSIISSLYHLNDSCSSIQSCRDKIWSSLYPDPKSEINKWDEVRGILV